MLEIVQLLAVITAVSIVLLVVVFREYSKDKSRWFVERQQLQSKIDTLSETIMQQCGVPVDLNRHTREIFKRKVDNAFKFGWKNDLPASPTSPQEKKG